MTNDPFASKLHWLLNDFADRMDDVRRVVLLSRDGLVMAASRSVSHADAEYLSALSAGLLSLAHGARDHFEAGSVHQTIVEMSRSLLFVTPAGSGSCLAVLSDASANAGMVSYETAMLIKRLQQHMAVAPRSAPSGPGRGDTA